MTKSRTVLAGKVLISATLMAVLLYKVDTSQVLEKIYRADLFWLLAALTLVCANVPIVAVRWLLLLRALPSANHATFRFAIAATFVGLFFGQALPGAVGGDLIRVWLAYRAGMKPGIVAASVIADRLSAVLGLVIVMGLSSPSLLSSADPRLVPVAVAAIAVLLLVLFATLALAPTVAVMLARKWPVLSRPRDLLLMVRRSTVSYAGAVALLLSIAVLCSTSMAVLAMARALSIELSLPAAFVVVPFALLIAVIPISIAGWGVRETGMVVGMSLYGMPASDAALISVLLGLGILASSLPGAAVWIIKRGRTHALPDTDSIFNHDSEQAFKNCN